MIADYLHDNQESEISNQESCFYYFCFMRIFIFSIAFLAEVALIACNQANSGSGQKKAYIDFDNTEYDLGTIAFRSDGECRFVFTNTGEEPLILSNVRSTCGCTVPDWPGKPVETGQSDTIFVQYDTRRVGSFTRTISVYANAENAPLRLTIRGKVLPKTESNKILDHAKDIAPGNTNS